MGSSYFEAGAELESLSELHPALVVEAVGGLDVVGDEGGVVGAGRVVAHADPRPRLQVVLAGRARRPVKRAEEVLM